MSALFGLLRGFVKESISLVKWILASWIAATFAGRLAPMIPIDSEAAAQATAFGLLFVLVFIIGALVNFVMSTLVKTTGLSGADRVFGLFFGVLRGAVIIIAFVLVGQTVALTDQDWWQDSILLERFERVAIELQDFIPDMKDAGVDTEQLMQKGAEHVIDNVDPETLMEHMNK